jgi:hypothetical protein
MTSPVKLEPGSTPVGSNTPSHRRRHDGGIKRAQKIIIAHEFMMCRRMVFREVICTVGAPRGPVKIELLLSNGIVSPKWSGRLWMPHF